MTFEEQPDSFDTMAAEAVEPDLHPSRTTLAFLRHQLCQVFPGQVALVSSFGVESAVLLHLVSRIDPATPVIFLDTGFMFAETLAYRDTLCRRLGLTKVRTIQPEPAAVAEADPGRTLHQSDPDLCCWHRKVVPLDDALDGYAAWITGRKRLHGGSRGSLKLTEREPGGRMKLNPLADWSADDMAAYALEHDLPAHPLAAKGYRSVGCAPCTRPTAPGDAPRAGRWAGQAKTECGIHTRLSEAQRRS